MTVQRSRYRYCPLCRTELTEGLHGGRPRLGCPTAGCNFVHWDNPIPVVAAIVERNGKVVLVRSHGWPDSYFALVSGFLEPQETPEAAVLREVEEEIGLQGEVAGYLGAYPFERMNQIIFAYHVLASDGPIRIGEDEIADYREVPIEKLRPWPQGTGPALRKWLAARGHHPPVVEFGTPLPDD